MRCLLNIWGVMLFLRLTWVIGQCGISKDVFRPKQLWNLLVWWIYANITDLFHHSLHLLPQFLTCETCSHVRRICCIKSIASSNAHFQMHLLVLPLIRQKTFSIVRASRSRSRSFGDRLPGTVIGIGNINQKTVCLLQSRVCWWSRCATLSPA